MKTKHATLGRSQDGEYISTVYAKGQVYTSKESIEEKAITFIRDKLRAMIEANDKENIRLIKETSDWEIF